MAPGEKKKSAQKILMEKRLDERPNDKRSALKFRLDI
jgi:hypothetical protein